MAEPNKIRRWPLLLLTLVAAGGVIAAALFGPGARKTGGLDPETPKTDAAVTSQATPAPPADVAAKDSTTTTPATTEPKSEASQATPLTGLRARLPQGTVAGTSRTSIGSLQPDKAGFLVDFSPGSAGIQRITFSDIWITAADREAALAHRAAIAAGASNPPALPPDEARYNLHTLGTLQGFEVPLLAARAIEIDGQLISLFGGVWTERGPGAFETEVADAEGNAIVRIRRVFAMEPAQGAMTFDMRLNQRVENVSGRPLKLRWIQYGPGDLSKDPGGMMDIRRFQFGYLYGAQRDPQRQNVIVHGAMFDRDQVMKLVDASTPMLWPQDTQRQQGFELSWFGTTNRYFALAVHAADPTASKGKVLSPVHEVWALSDAAAPADRVAFTELRSDAVMVAAGAAAAFDMGVFAGPLDPRLLEHVEPYRALRMDGLILYLISGCCSFCTFSWLANMIVLLLTFLHDHVVFDWSVAIIVLVALVRLALHPVTRYSQVQMARVTKGMAAIKPELEALQKRYASDPKRIQQEQFRLYREHNINPAGCVGGMLPTFLQMPIWIALYAVLYFAFDLRQAPAFFGLFQQFGGWGFLSDLSAPDKFVKFSQPLITWPFELSSINLIPLLMSVVFFFQQKYMAPPTTGTLTPEQQQQQKMMKWMTVILFPVMLYSAPSGLTLYIMTSTCVGIVEGKRIRAQIDRMDFSPRKGEPRKQDRLGKLYEAAMKRAQEKRSQGRRFKDRD
jgi:YidC/Oxa1 family membrane protein insertase